MRIWRKSATDHICAQYHDVRPSCSDVEHIIAHRSDRKHLVTCVADGQYFVASADFCVAVALWDNDTMGERNARSEEDLTLYNVVAPTGHNSRYLVRNEILVGLQHGTKQKRFS
jgi:hypothetical protein